MRERLFVAVALILLTGVIAPAPAFAYVGPGLGAGAIAVTLGVLGSIVTGILGVIYYPLKRIIKKFRTKRQSTQRQRTE